MSDAIAVKRELNEWGDMLNPGQILPARLARCGYCYVHYVITAPKLEPFVPVLRALGWAHTIYGWICPECHPAANRPDLMDDGGDNDNR